MLVSQLEKSRLALSLNVHDHVSKLQPADQNFTVVDEFKITNAFLYGLESSVLLLVHEKALNVTQNSCK